MTDEKIRALAEKTKKEKYCDKYRAIISGCKSECPFSNGYDYGCNVAYSEYQQAFLDGFRAGYKIRFDEWHDEGFTEARLGEDW